MNEWVEEGGKEIRSLILVQDTADNHFSITQQKDLICLGHLIVSLALMSPVAAQPENFANSVGAIRANYSADIENLVQ